ncbi:MAG: hypothetical protein ACLRSW_04575 [Christensenellaceae bacterium]
MDVVGSARSHAESGGVCVAACLDKREVGSQTLQGAGGVSKTYSNRLCVQIDDNEYYKTLARLFSFLSITRTPCPNHPEVRSYESTTLGGGVVIRIRE